MPARRILRFHRMACMLALLAVACDRHSPAAENEAPSLQLSSPSFSGTIPGRYASCPGQSNISPALTWTRPPAGTHSLAVIVTDPDAPSGPFTHWLLWNLPPDTRLLPESIATQPQLPSGARQGRNDFGSIGYGGPCPPGNSAHHYVFNVYALDATLALPPRATRQQLLHAIEGHILASGQLIGRYPR